MQKIEDSTPSQTRIEVTRYERLDITSSANHADQTASEQRILAVFHETNDHIRNADQKQLTITGFYLAVVAGVLSLLPSGRITILSASTDNIMIYAFLFITGCCVFLLQAWCRVWKEHYLAVVRRIAITWKLHESFLPYWLHVESPKQHPFLFNPNVDNTLLYFTFALNTAILLLLCRQLWSLMPPDIRTLAVAGISLLYSAFLIFTWRLSRNRRNLLAA